MSAPPSPSLFAQTLDLPCGAKLPNRLLKSAMSEQLGDAARNPSPKLPVLYRTWAKGGVGVQVTGNVMVDRSALGEPLNVVLDEQSDRASFRRWADAAREGGTRVWMQLNHPGKQSPAYLSREPVAPSAIPLAGSLGKMFRTPRALRSDEIITIIERFARAAELARETGFDGVQIHGAHGYLVSQFLSPHHNQRTDEWGGSRENRQRFALEVYRAIRARVGADVAVSIKLNSADFQRGGFTEDESLAAVDALATAGIDLIEISGGNYEAPAMTGFKVAESTRQREAFFLEFAEKVRARTRVPLAVTGGFRTGPAMSKALASGATDLIGLARPLALYPDLPARLFADPNCGIDLDRPSTGVQSIDRMLVLDITYYEAHLERMGRGLAPRPGLSAWRSVISTVSRMGASAFWPRRG